MESFISWEIYCIDGPKGKTTKIWFACLKHDHANGRFGVATENVVMKIV